MSGLNEQAVTVVEVCMLAELAIVRKQRVRYRYLNNADDVLPDEVSSEQGSTCNRCMVSI